MRFTQLWRRVVHHLRTYGLRGQLERFLAGLSLYREMPVYACDLDALPPPVPCRLPVAVTLLTPDALGEYLKAEGAPQASAVQAAWLAGDLCFVARTPPSAPGIPDRIVAWVWASERTHWLEYLQQPFVLSPREVYYRAAFTLPEFRGQGVLGELFAHGFRHHRQQGRQRAYAIILNFNRSSIRASERMGFRRLHVRGFVQFGPWRRYFVRGA